MGVSGAALATILPGFKCCMGSSVSYLKKSGVRLSLRTMKPDFSILGSVMALGISHHLSCLGQRKVPSYNRHEPRPQTYGGDLYVGSMTILQSVLQLIFGTGQRLLRTVYSRSSATTLVQASLTGSARQLAHDRYYFYCRFRLRCIRNASSGSFWVFSRLTRN